MILTKKFLYYIHTTKLTLNKLNNNLYLLRNIKIIPSHTNGFCSTLSRKKACFLNINSDFFFKSFAKFQHIIFLYYQFSTLSLFKANYFTIDALTLPKKIKKVTILRAPCNHKNSKEQYGRTTYKGILSLKYNSITHFLFNKYLIQYLIKKLFCVHLIIIENKC